MNDSDHLKHLHYLYDECGIFSDFNLKASIQTAEKYLISMVDQHQIFFIDEIVKPFLIGFQNNSLKINQVSISYFRQLFLSSSPMLLITQNCFNTIVEGILIYENKDNIAINNAYIDLCAVISQSFLGMVFLHGDILSQFIIKLYRIIDWTKDSSAINGLSQSIVHVFRQIFTQNGEELPFLYTRNLEELSVALSQYTLWSSMVVLSSCPYSIVRPSLIDSDIFILFKITLMLFPSFNENAIYCCYEFILSFLYSNTYTSSHSLFSELVCSYIMKISILIIKKNRLIEKSANLIITLWDKCTNNEIACLLSLFLDGVIPMIVSQKTHHQRKACMILKRITSTPELINDILLINQSRDMIISLIGSLCSLVEHAQDTSITVRAATSLLGVLGNVFGSIFNTSIDSLPKNQKIEVKEMNSIGDYLAILHQDPVETMRLMIKNKIISNNPETLAKFIQNTSSIDKKSKGLLISSISRKVLISYLSFFDFGNRDFYDSFYSFFSQIIPPSSAKLIDILLCAFSSKFFDSNPKISESEFSIYSLSFSVFCLVNSIQSNNEASIILFDSFVGSVNTYESCNSFPLSFLKGIYNNAISKPAFAYFSLPILSTHALIRNSVSDLKYIELPITSSLTAFSRIIDKGEQCSIIAIKGIKTCLQASFRLYLEENIQQGIMIFVNTKFEKELFSTIVKNAFHIRGIWKFVLEWLADELKDNFDNTLFDELLVSSGIMNYESIIDFTTSYIEITKKQVFEIPNDLSLLLKLPDFVIWNMERPLFHWVKIWSLIGSMLSTIGSSRDSHLAEVSIDLLKQLTLKFLKIRKNSSFKCQFDFMSPFFLVFENQQSQIIRKQIYDCLSLLIIEHGNNLLIGWDIIFQIMRQAALDSILIEESYALLNSIIDISFSFWKKHLVHLLSVVVSFSENCNNSSFLNIFFKICCMKSFDNEDYLISLIESIASCLRNRCHKNDDEIITLLTKVVSYHINNKQIFTNRVWESLSIDIVKLILSQDGPFEKAYEFIKLVFFGKNSNFNYSYDILYRTISDISIRIPNYCGILCTLLDEAVIEISVVKSSIEKLSSVLFNNESFFDYFSLCSRKYSDDKDTMSFILESGEKILEKLKTLDHRKAYILFFNILFDLSKKNSKEGTEKLFNQIVNYYLENINETLEQEILRSLEFVVISKGTKQSIAKLIMCESLKIRENLVIIIEKSL